MWERSVRCRLPTDAQLVRWFQFNIFTTSEICAFLSLRWWYIILLEIYLHYIFLTNLERCSSTKISIIIIKYIMILEDGIQWHYEVQFFVVSLIYKTYRTLTILTFIVVYLYTTELYIHISVLYTLIPTRRNKMFSAFTCCLPQCFLSYDVRMNGDEYIINHKYNNIKFLFLQISSLTVRSHFFLFFFSFLILSYGQCVVPNIVGYML